jgi:hypothetical protein
MAAGRHPQAQADALRPGLPLHAQLGAVGQVQGVGGRRIRFGHRSSISGSLPTILGSPPVADNPSFALGHYTLGRMPVSVRYAAVTST